MKASSLTLYKSTTLKEVFSKITPLGWIYIVAIIESICYLWYAGPHIDYDTWSYIEAWKELKDGHISAFRTPLYPFFLGIMYEIFGEPGMFWAVSLIQYIVLIFSLKYFYLTTGVFINQQFWQYVICYLYFLHPMLFHWASFALTEAFAIAGIIFLFYIMVSIWSKTYRPIYFFYLLLLLFLLIMLRPGFIFLIPILFLYSIIMLHNNFKSGCLSLICTFCSSILLLGYGLIYKYNFGTYGLSNVSTINQRVVLLDYDLWNNNLIQSPEEKEFMERLEKYGEDFFYWNLGYEGNWNKINSEKLSSYHAKLNRPEDLNIFSYIVFNQIKNNPIGYLKTIYLRAWKAQNRFILPLYTLKSDYYILSMITPCYNLYWLLFIIFSSYLLLYYHKFHKIPFLTFILFITCILGIFTAIVGGNEEWSRLSMPSMPLALLLIGILLDKLKPRERVNLP